MEIDHLYTILQSHFSNKSDIDLANMTVDLSTKIFLRRGYVQADEFLRILKERPGFTPEIGQYDAFFRDLRNVLQPYFYKYGIEGPEISKFLADRVIGYLETH